MTRLPTPQQLRFLLALAEHQHFGRAATACAVSQSTLSAGIIALERLLDVAILDRDGARPGGARQVAFTAPGRDLVRRAGHAMAALEAMADAAAAARGTLSGTLRVGVIPTIGPFLLPRLMPALREAYPGLRLLLREDTTPRLLERLQGDALDVLLLALPCDCAGAATLPLARDPFLVALPPGHRLAGWAAIPPAALSAERLLLLEDGHCLRDQALAACRQARRDTPDGDAAGPEATFAATSLHTLAQMVAGGLGVTLLPRLAVTAGVAAGTGLVLRPLEGPSAWRTIGLAWRSGAARTGDYRALARAVAAAAAPPEPALPAPADA